MNSWFYRIEFTILNSWIHVFNNGVHKFMI
jgi:hypothetical protein